MEENEDPDADALRDAWIESLMRSASRHDDHTRRISIAMQELVNQRAQLASPRDTSPRFRIGSLSLAATLAIAAWTLLLLNDGGTRVAAAVIDRSLQVASRMIPIEYAVRVKLQLPFGNSQTIESSLTVQGQDRFLFQRPGLLPGAYLRIGQHGDEYWVLPPVGPVLVGDQSSIDGWLREQDPPGGRLLHVDSLLNRMKSRQYRLTTLDDEEVRTPEGRLILCQRVSAVKTSEGPTESPDRIELWASRRTGMAMRLSATWELSNDAVGIASYLMDFQSERPELTDEWFLPEAHSDRERQTIRFHYGDE